MCHLSFRSQIPSTNVLSSENHPARKCWSVSGTALHCLTVAQESSPRDGDGPHRPAAPDPANPPHRQERIVTRRYLLIALAIATFVLLSFLIVEALGIPLLVDPSSQLGRGGIGAAVLGVGLLIVDVFLPVPSSIVMTAQGALFGIVLGTALSMIGSVGAALVGFAIGRKGTRFITRFVSPEEQAASNRLLERWGPLALIVTRPVPILAETTAVMAGASSLSWGKAALGIVVGAFPAALIYAIAGAYATSVASGVLVFVLVIVLAGGFWLIGWFVEQHFLMPRREQQEERTQNTAER